jgi:hypothetical protein
VTWVGEFNYVSAAIEGVAAALEQRGLFEFVEETDEVGWIQAEGLAERDLWHRAALAKDRERDEVAGPEPGRLERGLGAAPGDPREVVDQHERLM